MAKLFITREQLVKSTILDGNIDNDKMLPFIKISQEIHIQNYLGTKLYERISNDIENNTLAGDYLELVTDYIQPMLIHYSMVEYLPVAAYQVKNGGVFKHRSENAETPSKDEIDFLVQKYRDFAEYYTRRLVDFMCFDSNKFPEYNDNQDSDIDPEKDTNISRWVL
mgnify:CR=1 FL=1